jgi:hypothetical protein
MVIALVAPVAVTARSVADTSALIPVPPDFFTCVVTGVQTTCRGTTVGTDSGPLPVWCGSDEAPVQLFSETTEINRRTLVYDAAGRLTRIVEQFTVDGTILDPATGRSASQSQVATVSADLDVPGDPTTGIRAIRGVVRFAAPHVGTLLVDVGRELFTADDVTVWSAGQHPIDAFFAGDPSVMAQLCAALGSPGTPSVP